MFTGAGAKTVLFQGHGRIPEAKFKIGAVVKHRLFPFRGVVFDIDPVFANTEEWYNAIPAEVRPRKDQPFYHLFAENAEPNTSPMCRNRTCCRMNPASRCATRRSRKCSSAPVTAATSPESNGSTQALLPAGCFARDFAELLDRAALRMIHRRA